MTTQEISELHRTDLEQQIKEAYGKLVYSYTTQNKSAQIKSSKNKILKRCQIVLSSISTAGFLGTVIFDPQLLTMIAGISSALLLAINLFFKDFNLDNEIIKHRQAANELWLIREDYISLLTDFISLTTEEIMDKRDELQKYSFEVYKIAPPTCPKAYKLAQKALKKAEEQYFSEEELNLLLASHLRKTKKC